jgi:hypothetical protein
MSIIALPFYFILALSQEKIIETRYLAQILQSKKSARIPSLAGCGLEREDYHRQGMIIQYTCTRHLLILYIKIYPIRKSGPPVIVN